MLLVASVPWGWASVIYYFNLPVPLQGILSLSIAPFLCIYAAFIPYTLGRGYVSGLLLILYFYPFNIMMTLAVFF